MIRSLLAGLAAALAFTSAASAAPPPPAPALPEDTPPAVQGYDTAEMYRAFILWTEREAEKAVNTAHEQHDLLTRVGGDVRVVSFRVHGDWPYTDLAGSLEQECDTDPDDMIGLITGAASLAEEEIAERCYWQLLVFDGKDAKTLAQSWMGKAFDPQAAAAHLASLGIRPGSNLMAQAIDWTGYRDASAMARAPVLRTRRYTSRTCDAFEDSLKAYEGMTLGDINIDGFGKPSEIEYGIAHSPWLNVTVFSINGGSRAEVSFSGTAGIVANLLNPVDAIIGQCEAEPSG